MILKVKSLEILQGLYEILILRICECILCDVQTIPTYRVLPSLGTTDSVILGIGSPKICVCVLYVRLATLL